MITGLRTTRLLTLAIALAGFIHTEQTPALRWHDAGHQVVAAIAWAHLAPATREKVIALLRAAPADADLVAMMPQDGRPLALREKAFFMAASTWADVVRSSDKPQRKAAYDHSSWHYINYFWVPTTEGPLDLPDRSPAPENIVERLTALSTTVADPGLPAAERAVQLAWILHLVGDLHQPLHTSARVTPGEPEGDRGGNLFKLDAAGQTNLHAYWDGILDRAYPRQSGETTAAYASRLADILDASYTRQFTDADLRPGDVAAWAREGYEAAKEVVYLSSLQRGQEPDEAYEVHVFTTAERVLARAGLRLAALLNEAFAG